MYEMAVDHDVIVIGGGIAGQSAALMLGRAHVSVGLIDDPDTAVYSGETHNMLTNDGKTKSQILAEAGDDLARYPTIIRHSTRAEAIEKDACGYAVTLTSGEVLTTAHLIFAMGYHYPANAMKIGGFDERFGGDIFTCPYCHGFEYTDRRIALIGSSTHDGQFLRLLSNWSSQLTYLRHDGPNLDTDAFSNSPGNLLVDDRVSRLDGPLGAPVVVLEDGRRIETDVIFIADLPGGNRWSLIEGLGIEREPHSITGKPVYKTDAVGRTDLRDVFIIGDTRTGFSGLSGAANEGTLAGFMLTNDIIESRSSAGAIRQVV